MMTSSSNEITQLLIAWSDGDEGALAQLIPLVEAELHRLASLYLSRERPGHTLQPTALINEVYLRLINWKSVRWKNHAQFIGIAAQLMKHVLVNHAIHRRRRKRRGEEVRVSLTEADKMAHERSVDIVALNDALDGLAEIDPRKRQIIELRFFSGLSVEETAEVLKIAPRTVEREWKLAKAWLYRELSKEEKDES
jgi:RNA polymerase sigma factor (TIGR02999 family)